jgi:hypothetical protein
MSHSAAIRYRSCRSRSRPRPSVRVPLKSCECSCSGVRAPHHPVERPVHPDGADPAAPPPVRRSCRPATPRVRQSAHGHEIGTHPQHRQVPDRTERGRLRHPRSSPPAAHGRDPRLGNAASTGALGASRQLGHVLERLAWPRPCVAFAPRRTRSCLSLRSE